MPELSSSSRLASGFFLSIMAPKTKRPGPPLGLLHTDIVTLSVGTLTPGIGLLRSL